MQRERFLICCQSFNSRSREGSDQAAARRPLYLPEFQFALPRGERRATAAAPNGRTPFQFALPRGERRSPR